jgi:hypothetical protein
VGTVDEVRIVFEDRLIARHVRCWDREQFRFDPIHYLALLERKPGGFDFARPLNQWVLPECFGVLRRRLEADGSDGFGTRGFIRVLRLLEVYSLPQLRGTAMAEVKPIWQRRWRWRPAPRERRFGSGG